MTASPDIFLSYNREDAEVARRFAEGFEAQGFEVWWDQALRSGEAYDEVTEAALRGAKAVVVLWSKKSVVSRWVRAEATLADRNRTLVPARIELCDLPIMFELTQTAELTRWQGDVGDPAWRAFLGDVRGMVGMQPEPVQPTSQQGSKPPSRGNKPSIAVLPFINRSGLAEDDVFADGMVEDLTAALSLSKRMKVIAASATASYRSGARDLREIGRELGVRYLLEGNVRRVGDDFRVSAQLVEADDGDILWTQKFDRPLSEVAVLQEDLVTEVAARLGVEVQRAEMEHALRKPGNITAWEAVLRAEANLSRFTQAGIEEAVSEAKRAIAIDPAYDAAYGVLAMALCVQENTTFDEGGGIVREAFAAITRLRELETNDPIALARAARALAFLGKNKEALPIAERAVSINPNLDVPHLTLGGVLVNLGRWEEALEELAAMDRIAPSGIWAHASKLFRSIAHLCAGRAKEAFHIIEGAARISPHGPAQLHKVICLAELDEWDDARNAMRVLRESNPAMTMPIIEKQVRSHLYGGVEPQRADRFVAVMGRLWTETEQGL